MTAQTLSQVAAAIRNNRLSFDFDADLPLPNIYWCSASKPSHGTAHTHLAADHTTAVIQKMANWCAEHRGFRPMRSNSRVRVRRMKLGDLLENPDAHRVALQNAALNGERDIIAALNALPQWIAAQVGLYGSAPAPVLPKREVRPAVDLEAAWERLTQEIAALGPSAHA